ncbi:hypothetical protein BDZ94DRAFT_1312002 [Collybia nuda]|uniref:Uncharacterized protein n=1 Tax=Collybia nuda TaxID=64659 RepID=A0A9P5Y008_9AGAR|nr:hypothetical protein BDZ94DRAFT_1312002 [Collybia nuda]
MRFTVSTIALLALVTSVSAVALPEAKAEAGCLASITFCVLASDCCSGACGRFSTFHFDVCE